MSYILEALKKAEHQRDIGRVPGIGSEHQPVVAAAATGRWKWVLVAVLGVNAVLLTFALWPRHPATEQKTAAVAVPAASPVAPATARAAPHTSVPEPAPADKQAVPPAPVAVVAPTPAPAAAMRPLPPLPQSVKSTPAVVHEASKVVPPTPEPIEADDNLPAATAPPVTAKAAPRTSVREPAPAVKQAEPPAPVAVVAPPPTPAPPLPQSVKSTPAVVHEAPKVVPPTPELFEADANLPVWPQVSPDLFRAIDSDLHLDVHVYSKVPQQRLVLINTRKYTEGQRLQEGPVVDAIRPDGVILSFQGQRFRLTAQ
jgi:general secretion pathway protein B